MSKSKKWSLTNDNKVDNLIERLYRISQHSYLATDILGVNRRYFKYLGKTEEGREKFEFPFPRITPDGLAFSEYYGKDLDREKVESLAARCRPLIMSNQNESAASALRLIHDKIHTDSSLDNQTKQKQLEKIKGIIGVWDYFSRESPKIETIEKILKQNDCREFDPGFWAIKHVNTFMRTVIINEKEISSDSDIVDIGHAWLYSDLIHNDFTRRQKTTPHNYHERYSCAVPYIFNIANISMLTLGFIIENKEMILKNFSLSKEIVNLLQNAKINHIPSDL